MAMLVSERARAIARIAFLSCFVAAPCGAHVTLESREGVAGTNHKAVIRVPHGCEGSPTVAIRVRLPDTIVQAKPQPKPGWTVNVVRTRLAKPITDAHGNTVTERVSEVAWSGGRLLDEHYDEFVIRVALPDTPGATLYFPVVQQCEKGIHRWIEIPEPGKSRRDYREPAPSLHVIRARR